MHTIHAGTTAWGACNSRSARERRGACKSQAQTRASSSGVRFASRFACFACPLSKGLGGPLVQAKQAGALCLLCMAVLANEERPPATCTCGKSCLGLFLGFAGYRLRSTCHAYRFLLCAVMLWLQAQVLAKHIVWAWAAPPLVGSIVVTSSDVEHGGPEEAGPSVWRCEHDAAHSHSHDPRAHSHSRRANLV